LPVHEDRIKYKDSAAARPIPDHTEKRMGEEELLGSRAARPPTQREKNREL
jgi:hypothetical protein